jgi:ribosomal protein S18 acetylase RimI-like enzyme
MKIRAYEAGDRDAVVALWQDCELLRPWNDPDADIERKLANSADLFLVAEVEGRIVASVMAGYDGHRGWMNYLAVQPGQQRTGIGRRLVAEAEQRLRDLGCPKINLQIRDTNLKAREFYEAIGYTEDPVVSYGKRLVRDE